ncbi:MAG: dinitrogenase iron-molybdenum cofactor biosynthesis protein [Lentisphaeria bacterium]|nr:dinitrogenase iron-molybdenum cofactor biosynthesis protein [Lentisphaeria bacterium]
MKIAVTCGDHQVFQHFGHTPGFAVFEAEDGKIISEKILSSGESGHGALALVLAEEMVDVLICGGIGGGAINALTAAGIRVIGGADGDVREVAEAFAAGTLKVREDFHCNHHHHGEGHTCGSHGCGSGKCSH